MAVNITMPKWGLTMKKGKLSKWFKKEGDKVKEGEDLFEVETEKITNKVQSVAGGILFQIVVSEGMTVPVGTIVAVIADPDEKPTRIEGIQMGEIVELAAPSKEKQVPPTPEKPKEKEFVAVGMDFPRFGRNVHDCQVEEVTLNTCPK